LKASAATIVLGAALIAAATAGPVSSGAARSQTPDGLTIVKQRQALMKRQNRDLRAIKNYLDGKGDPAKAQAAAADVVQTTRHIPDLVPPNTGMAQYPGKSGAKPVIWSDYSGFLTAQRRAVAKADALSDAMKSGDKAASAAALEDLYKNGCDGCHKTYREKL